jgi:hypothetical protein
MKKWGLPLKVGAIVSILLVVKGITPVFIARFRTELSNVDKVSNRIETITKTSFISAAYDILITSHWAASAADVNVDIPFELERNLGSMR